jgi:hypothetical protein
MSRLASIIDYVRDGLDPKLWEKDRLRPEIRDEMEDIVYSMLDDLELPEQALLGVYIYGSILTNQWNPKTDVDVRILLDPELVYKKYPKVTGDDIFDMVIEKIHDIPLGETQHPFNATVVIKGEPTELGKSELGVTEADPVYDVLKEEMVVPPAFEEEFDPDEVFEEDRAEADRIMEELDALLRETKTDVLDYEIIQEAVQDVKNPDVLLDKLESKLEEIQEDIESLVKEYTGIKDRRTKSLTEGPEEDWRKTRHWAPGNVQHKYLERYKYLDVLRKLKRIFKGGVTEEEVDDVAEALQVR